MVGIHGAGSAANVRRMPRETPNRISRRCTGYSAGLLGPVLEDRTCASGVLNFERNERPTPEQSTAVGRLETALAKDPRSAAEPFSLVIQTRRLGVETRAAQALNKFIDDFQRVFGKEV